MDDTNKLVKSVISEQLGSNISTVKSDSLLVENLGMDSFDAVEIIFDLENKTGVKISQEDMLNIKTVKDIIEFIKTAKEH